MTATPPIEGDLSASGELVELTPVCTAFGLGAPVRVIVIAEGLMNRNWRVDTAVGSFAVKQIRDVDAAQAMFQHGVTRRLADGGLPVPAPLETPAGRTVAVVGGQPYAVLPWVDGEHLPPLAWTAEQCGQVGELLGRIHLLLREVRPAGPAAVRPQVPDLAMMEEKVDRYLELVAQRVQPDAFDAFVVERLVQRRALLARIGELRPDGAVELVPAGYTHGDFHDLNLLFVGGRIGAVVDWDRLGVRSWCYELARAATLMFGYGDERGMDLVRTAAFAAGYTAVTGVTGGEVAAAAQRLWWDRVADLWQLKSRYVKHDTSCDHLFRSASALVDWWTDHRDAVSEALTSR